MIDCLKCFLDMPRGSIMQGTKYIGVTKKRCHLRLVKFLINLFNSFDTFFQSWFLKSFNSCVMKGEPECNFSADGSVFREQQLTYFCGSAIECRQIGNRDALEVCKILLNSQFSSSRGHKITCTKSWSYKHMHLFNLLGCKASRGHGLHLGWVAGRVWRYNQCNAENDTQLCAKIKEETIR